jgi:putative sporulation protein YtaF
MPTVQLLSILVFAISSNFDNVGVGIAYGIRGTCIPFASNLIIALISGTGTLLSMLVGTSLYRFLKPEVATVVGGFTMIGIGIWVIIQGTRQLRKTRSPEEQLQNRSKDLSQKTTLRKIFAVLDDPFIVDPDCTGNIRAKESVLLGLGLTLNNLVNGVAAGMLGLSLFLVTFFTIILSILAIWLGRTAGNSYASRWIGHLTGPVSGLLLISIGIYEIFL